MRYPFLSFATCLLIVLLFVATCSCSSRNDRVPIVRLDYAIEESDTMSEVRLDSLNRTYDAGIRALRIANIANSELMTDDGLKGLRYSNSLAFTPAVRKRADDLNIEETILGEVKHRMADQFPEVRFPTEIYAVEWPYSQTMALFGDSVLLIAMNHYLGEDFEGYSGFEDYKRRQKTLQRLPYDVVEAVIRAAYPFERDNATVVSRLVYEGAVVEAVSSIVPGSDERSALGYSTEEMKWAQDNEYPVWQTLAASGLLFSGSEFDMGRLVDPSPATLLVHPEAPGRLGRYVGLQLVKALEKQETDISLWQILSPDVYSDKAILQRAKYVPHIPR